MIKNKNCDAFVVIKKMIGFHNLKNDENLYA